MKTNYFDLRFLIGLFFLIVGLIVVASSFGSSSIPDGGRINLYSGLFFLVFAVIMLFSFWSGRKDPKE